ncbi:MAG: DUF3303 family protein [Thermoproteota archaeon]
MKFIAFWEFNAEDTNKVIEKFKVQVAEAEKFPKTIFGPYNFIGETKGFTILETDDPDKLMNSAIYYDPELKFKFIPIIETTKGAELWLGMKK